jgi:hypothetical protein
VYCYYPKKEVPGLIWSYGHWRNGELLLLLRFDGE